MGCSTCGGGGGRRRQQLQQRPPLQHPAKELKNWGKLNGKAEAKIETQPKKEN